MNFRRSLPAFAFGLLIAFVAAQTDTDLAAEETKAEKRKAFLKKVLENKKKSQPETATDGAKAYVPDSPPPARSWS